MMRIASNRYHGGWSCRLLLWVVFLIGCDHTLPPPRAATPAAVATPAAPPALVYDVEQPLQDHGVSQIGVDEHVYSIGPDGGPVFGLTFAVPGVGLRFEVPRAWLTVGVAQSFDVGASLFVIVSGRTCLDWSGEFIVAASEPTSWSVYIDAHCTTDATLRLQGQWSGR